MSAKRYSFGFTNTFREGRSLANVFAVRINPTASTKVYLSTQRVGGGKICNHDVCRWTQLLIQQHFIVYAHRWIVVRAVLLPGSK
ncbi:MAG: hypothetical protein IIC13_14330 [SAR324 cluster bacterium]|nr:hypothetical protein [SAR324 cluster bacterium]